MSRAERLFIALAAACASAPIGYAALRCAEYFLYPKENPAVIVWSERSGYVWRIALALYLSGALLFGSYALVLRSPDKAARLLYRFIAFAFVLGVLQSVALP